MAELTLVVDRQHEAGPVTHAVVIGVGYYPHLLGGPAVVDPALTEGMGQLSSPPRSAVAFVDWLARSHEDPRAPLATVDLLVSAGPEPFTYEAHDGRVVEVEPALKGAVAAALKAWKRRGNAHEDNSLVFFFCGHGVVRGFQTALLASDYASDEEKPFDGAFWFEGMREGMRPCAARRQLYLVDACRVGSDALLRGHTVQLDNVLSPNGVVAPGQAQASFYATVNGFPAYGVPDQPSIFTRYLLRGLGGMAASDDSGEWWVDTSRLQNVFKQLATRFAEPEHFGIEPPAGGEQVPFEFHRLPAAPAVPFLMEWSAREGDDEPPARIDLVALSREDGRVLDWAKPWGAPADCQWERGRFRSDQVAGMRYSWSVKFDDGTIQTSAPRTLNPPFRIVEFPRDAVA